MEFLYLPGPYQLTLRPGGFQTAGVSKAVLPDGDCLGREWSAASQNDKVLDGWRSTAAAIEFRANGLASHYKFAVTG